MIDNKILSLSPANVNKSIEGRYLRLKPISINEVSEKYLSWITDLESNRFLEVHFRDNINYEYMVEYINSLRSKNGCELFAIFTKGDELHIGNATITSFNEGNQGIAEFGIMIGDERARNSGMGGEVYILLLEYIFSDPLIHRVGGGVAADNKTAWKILESLGFIREGTIRESFVYPNGERTDAYKYGMLRGEWELNRTKYLRILKSYIVSEIVLQNA